MTNEPRRPINRKRALALACITGLLAVPATGALAQEYGTPPSRGAGPPGGQPQQPAQPQQPRSPQPGAPQPGAGVPAEKLDQFVDAYSNVKEVREKYIAKINEKDDLSQARELQQEARTKIEDAVRDAGLTVSEYHQIASRMENDPALQQRIRQRMGR